MTPPETTSPLTSSEDTTTSLDEWIKTGKMYKDVPAFHQGKRKMVIVPNYLRLDRPCPRKGIRRN
jgi:hypothetical protein